MSSRRIGVGLPPRPTPKSRYKSVESTDKSEAGRKPTALSDKQDGSALLSTVSSRMRNNRPTFTTATTNPFPTGLTGPAMNRIPQISPLSTPKLATSYSPVLPPVSSPKLSTRNHPQTQRVLRRKRSIIRDDSSRTSSSSSAPHSWSSLDRQNESIDLTYDISPTELPLAQHDQLPRTLALSATIYPELDRYRHLPGPHVTADGSDLDPYFRLPSHSSDLHLEYPSITPGYYSVSSSQVSAVSAGSSRFSESPAYSRNTTPISVSSQSPSLTAPSRLGSRKNSTGSPADRSRPPVTRRRAGSISNDTDAQADTRGLSVVRESLTTSSSTSTFRNLGPSIHATPEKPQHPQHPTPPLRKSSINFGSTRLKSGPASPPIRLQSTPASPPMRLQSGPASPSMRLQSGPASPPMRLQSGPASPSMRLQSGHASPPIRLQSSPASPPMRLQSGPASPPLRLRSGPASPPIRLQYSPASPPIQLQSGPASPSMRLQSGPASPPLRLRSGLASPPMRLQSGPSSPPMRLQSLRATPPSDPSVSIMGKSYSKADLPSKVVAPSRSTREGTLKVDAQTNGDSVMRTGVFDGSFVSEMGGSRSYVASAMPKSETRFPLPEKARRPVGTRPVIATNAPGSRIAGSTKVSQQESSRTLRTPSPSLGASALSRLPFLRRNKNPSDPPAHSEMKKEPTASRKGPIAGTGHEYYGRFSVARRRSGSISSISTRGITSQFSFGESPTGDLAGDYFLLERINPVIIAGGEVKENQNHGFELHRTESDQSLAPTRSSLESERSVRSALRTTLWPSAFPSLSSRGRRQSDGSDSDASSLMPRMTFRKTLRRSEQSADPRPVEPSRSTAQTNTIATTTASLEPAMFSRNPRPLKSGGILTTTDDTSSSAPSKRPKSPPRKWNFFNRTHNQPSAPVRVPTPFPEALKALANKPVAYYLVDSSEQEDGDPIDAKQYLSQHGLNSKKPQGFSYESIQLPKSKLQLPNSLPQQPTLPDSSVKCVSPQQPTPEAFSTLEVQDSKRPDKSESSPIEVARTILSSGKPSRLLQVGRIPKVVRQEKPEQSEVSSARIFSRPFQGFEVQTLEQNMQDIVRESVAKGPTPPQSSKHEKEVNTTHLRIESSLPTSLRIFDSNIGPELGLGPPKLRRCPPISGTSDATKAKELLAFSPRHSSVETSCTTSSRSSSTGVPVNAATVIARPYDPHADDEIWDEYNDLLGDDGFTRLSRYNSKKIRVTDPAQSSEPLDFPESPTISPRSIQTHRWTSKSAV